MEDLIARRQAIYNEIYDRRQALEEEVKNLEKTISKINSNIYDICEHNWVRDRDSQYDRAYTYCTKCNMHLRPATSGTASGTHSCLTE